MKSFFTATILLMSFSAFSADVVIKSEAIPTCYQRSNTAINDAIKNAEQKALKKCSDPILVDLQTQIISRACGSVQVIATYECI